MLLQILTLHKTHSRPPAAGASFKTVCASHTQPHTELRKCQGERQLCRQNVGERLPWKKLILGKKFGLTDPSLVIQKNFYLGNKGQGGSLVGQGWCLLYPPLLQHTHTALAAPNLCVFKTRTLQHKCSINLSGYLEQSTNSSRSSAAHFHCYHQHFGQNRIFIAS